MSSKKKKKNKGIPVMKSANFAPYDAQINAQITKKQRFLFESVVVIAFDLSEYPVFHADNRKLWYARFFADRITFCGEQKKQILFSGFAKALEIPLPF